MTSESKEVEMKPVIIDSREDLEDVLQALEKLTGLSKDDQTETKMLRSRIEEQSSLICMLKQRASDMLLRCQALERINDELENLQTHTQTKLQDERDRSEQLEQRFMDLAANHRELIVFKDEYKRQNAELVKENKDLQESNKKLFSKELQEKEKIIQKLTQEFKNLSDQNGNLKKEYRDKTTDFQMKMKKMVDVHRDEEVKLKDELHKTQKQLKTVMKITADTELKWKQSQERNTMKELETQQKLEVLKKDKKELLELSMQRGKMIQDKQDEMKELEIKKQEAEKAKQDAEDRFIREAAAVNRELKVMELQDSLHKAEEKWNDLKKEFEAYKRHTSDLLAQEKELNSKLRHMMT